MKLLKEDIKDFAPLIVEATEGKPKEYWIEGIFLQGDIENHNKRKYPMSILEPEVNRYIKENVERNRAYGELGHPDTPNINYDRMSHMIKELYRDGNNFAGKAKVIDTPMGKIVQVIMDEKGTFGMSTRGTGSLKQVGGIMEVGPDFKLATAGDIVHSPSAPDAWMKTVMESTDFWFDEAIQAWTPYQQNKIEEAVDTSKSKISKMNLKQIQENKIKLFEDFLQILVESAKR